MQFRSFFSFHVLTLSCCTRNQWRSQGGGGTLVHVPPPRRHTGKIFKSMDLLLLAMKDRYAFSICLQLLGAKTDPMTRPNVYRHPWGEYSPQKPIKFFLYLGLELSIVKKANNKTVV